MAAQESHPLSAAALVWLLGAVPEVCHLSGHGPPGRTAAVVLGVIGLIAACTSVVEWLSSSERFVAAAIAAVGAELLTISRVGRAPALVAMLGVVVAARVCRGEPVEEEDEDEERSDRRVLAVPLALLVAGAACGAAGATRVWVALTLLSVALCSLFRSWPDEFGWLEARSIRTKLEAPLRLPRRSAAWTTAPSQRPARILGAAVAVASVPMFWRLATDRSYFIYGTNDINSGLPRIRALSLIPFNLSVAHPGWLALVRVLTPVFGESITITGLAALATGASVMVLAAVARTSWQGAVRLRWPWAIACAAGYFLLETPAVLVPRGGDVWRRFEFAGQFARGSGFWGWHLWAVPTVVFSIPFVFAMFFLVVRRLTVPWPDDRRRWGDIWIAVLTVVTTLIQPATTLAVAPAVLLYLSFSARRRDRRAWSSALCFVIPGAVVCILQVVFLSSNVSEYEQAEWIWDPFWHWHHFGLDRLPMWLVFLIVPASAWVAGRRYVRDVAVVISLVALVVALPPFLLLRQTTVAAIPDADLSIPPIMAMMLLFVASLRLVALECQHRFGRERVAGPLPPWFFPVGTLFALMLVAGVVDLLAAAAVLPGP